MASNLATLGVGGANSSVNFGSPTAHYDASILGLSNGATVSNWPDSAGIQGAFGPDAGTPTYITNAQNGLSAIEFSTTATHLNANWAVVPTRPFTCIIAGKSLSTASQSVWFHQTFNISFGITAPNWQVSAVTSLAGGTPDSTTWHVFTFVINGASSVLRVDGVQVAAGTTGSDAGSGVICQLLGAFRYGEIYAYNSDATALGTEAFLRTKWGTA